MLMVIFGAGASFDSYAKEPPPKGSPDALSKQRLPLAKDLFDDRTVFLEAADRFPAVKPLLPFLRKPPRGLTLEAYLADLQSNARPQRQAQLAAVRYYLQAAIAACEQDWRRDYLHDTTNQLALLDQIEEWRHARGEGVWLVTFNYDTMLEAALQQYLDPPIVTLEDYVREGQPYNLVKLHGSIHWYRYLDEGHGISNPSNDDSGARSIARAASTLRVSQRYHCFRQDPSSLRGSASRPYDQDGKKAVYPAIAIPIEGKQEFECPSDHLAALTQALPEIDRMIVIGWGAAEQNFLSLLKKHTVRPIRRGLVVAANERDAAAVGEKIRHSTEWGGDFTPSKSGFTETLLGDGFRNFLHETS